MNPKNLNLLTIHSHLSLPMDAHSGQRQPENFDEIKKAKTLLRKYVKENVT